MHTSRTARSLTLAASIAAGVALVAVSNGASAQQRIQTIDHRTNPTGAGPNRSGVTPPNANDQTGKSGFIVKATVGKTGTTSGDIQGCLFCAPTGEHPRTGQNMQTIDHRTNATGAGSHRQGATPGSGDGWTPTVRDEHGKTTSTFFHGRVIIGTTSDGKPIYSDYLTSSRTYSRRNKDGSIDLVHVQGGGDEPGQITVERYKGPPHIDLGSCPPWGC